MYKLNWSSAILLSENFATTTILLFTQSLNRRSFLKLNNRWNYCQYVSISLSWMLILSFATWIMDIQRTAFPENWIFCQLSQFFYVNSGNGSLKSLSLAVKIQLLFRLNLSAISFFYLNATNSEEISVNLSQWWARFPIFQSHKIKIKSYQEPR